MNPVAGDSKTEIRAWAKSQRANLTAVEHASASQAILERLKPLIASFECVGLYASFDNEVDLFSLSPQPGQRFVLPRLVDRETMEFVPFNDDIELNPNKFGILEPVGEAVPGREIDALIVPGLAFDRRGGRVGFGGGYYDRFIARRLSVDRPLTVIGVAMEWQLVDTIAMDEYDQMMDSVVTENAVISITEEKSDG